MRRTVEECVEGVVLDLAEFEEVLACSGTSLHLEVDDQLPEGGLEHDRHADGGTVGMQGSRTALTNQTVKWE